MPATSSQERSGSLGTAWDPDAVARRSVRSARAPTGRRERLPADSIVGTLAAGPVAMTAAAPLSTLVVAGRQRLKSVLAQRDQIDDQVEAAEQAGCKGSAIHGESTV
jgi:hypothetical protein